MQRINTVRRGQARPTEKTTQGYETPNTLNFELLMIQSAVIISDDFLELITECMNHPFPREWSRPVTDELIRMALAILIQV